MRSSMKRLVFLLISIVFIIGGLTTYGQIYNQQNFAINQPNNNYFANSSVFKQEIVRMEFTVTKAGKQPLPITQVPRLEKDDVLKVRMLEEPVNSMKPDQSNFDWTFIVAYINPGRSNDSTTTVSEEINFRKKGWYKEHSFTVPYDCQPIFFIYPKSQYRSKILNLINKNQEVIQKIGEKTIEIADAYAKIGMFLNELQDVVNRNYYRGYYNQYNYNYGGVYGNTTRNFGYNDSFLAEQTIERLARSFNIQMPSCWTGNQYNPYGNFNNNGYNNGYYNNNNYNNGYNNYYNYGYGTGNDLVGRVQCLAKTVRVEDFDISVAQMLQQGGIFAAAQLTQKYPQIAFWINIAAAALDFIIKITNRAPLKIIPTVVAANENQANGYLQGNAAQQNKPSNSARISLFAENPPNDRGFVTAYPMVFHKWQADADPGVINMPMPVLANSCLHAGQNIIRTTDVLNDWIKDNFAKEFQLTLTSGTEYKKDFELRKNIGFGGWELAISKEELNKIAKTKAPVEGVVTGKRGFNKIQSAVFNVPLSSTAIWTIESNSQKSFTVGGKRTVTLQNQNGDCRCLETVLYKPAQGQESFFETKKLTYSPDGKEVSFEVDTTNLTNGAGQLELRQYGGETLDLNINLYPVVPNVTDVKVSKGDTQVKLIGERLDQIEAVRIIGKRAVAAAPVSQISDREKTFIFENGGQWQDSNSFSLELELSDQRTIKSPNLFGISASRPVFVANEAKEIEGFVINKLANGVKNLSVFPMETDKVGINIQNALTDYDFKIENLTVETRVENTETNPFQENDISYEVLDWRSMRLNINLTEQAKKFLGGRRIQFRILDGKRGESDWYSIKQTFVRMPQITTLKCSNKECEVIGKGISYIQQISLDDGKTWFPNEPTGLVAKSIENNLEMALVPNSLGSKSIKIKLRDFPTTDGIPMSITNR